MDLKSLCLVFIVFSFTSIPHSMAQGWLWAKNAGGTGNETAEAVTTDTAGNIYVAGSFSSASFAFGSFTLNNTTPGYTDIYVVKYDPNGNVLWAASAGGSDNDYATSIALDAWGNIYVAGFFYSNAITFGTATLINDSAGAATCDMYVVKYNPAGNVMWAQRAGGTLDDQINSVKTDVAGNVVVTGSFESKYLIFGTDTVKNVLTTTDEVFVIKYDSTGNYVWATGSGGGGYDYAYAITTDTANNIFVAGKFNSPSISFGSISLTNSGTGTDDLFLVKCNSAGVAQWVHNATGTNDDIATALGIDVENNIYMTGIFTSTTLQFNTTTLINTGGYDVFAVKYNTGGDVLWAKSIGTDAMNNYPASLSVDDSSNLVIAGNFGNVSIPFGATTITNNVSGTYNLFIAKYDSSGSAKWANTTGAAGADANGVATDQSGNIYLAGSFSDSAFYFGTNLLLNAGMNTGSTDLYLAKYTQSATSVMQVNSPAYSIALYPNPANGIINVVLNGGGYNNISIYDCTGRGVYQRQLTGNEKNVQINTSQLTDGTYFVRTIPNAGTESAAFVITR